MRSEDDPPFAVVVAVLVCVCAGAWIASAFLRPDLSWQGRAASADDGTTIRVLVVYTQAARAAAGSLNAVEARIQEALERTNQSYQDSGITQQLVLAGMREIAYTETHDLGADLAALSNSSHLELGIIHQWREQDYADLVNLVVSEGDVCYQSHQMTDPSPAFAEEAFSVVRFDCMVAELGFPMALGHNMGARLDWFVDDGKTPFTYSHGYVNWEAGWRTVMTSELLCTAKGTGCQHLWRWSNPTLNYDGLPMGFPEGTGQNCIMGVENNPPCDADNARVLNQTASIVANFRTGPPPTSTPSPSPTAPAEILLVNDEGLETPEVEPYYVAPLQTLQAPFDYWNTTSPGLQEPDKSQLNPYQIVIWFTGRNLSEFTGPEPLTERALGQWIGNERCFLIFSQDYYQPNEPGQPTDFMKEILGVQTVYEDLAHTSITGLGPFGGMGSMPLVEPTEYPTGWNFSDALVPAPGAQIAFEGDQGTAGLFVMRRNYRAGYMAFPLEMLPDESARLALLQRFLQTCQFWNLFLPILISP